MPKYIKDKEIVKQRLRELESMDLGRLKVLWHKYFGYKPPRYQREYMLPRIAYHVQALAYGGLSQKAKNTLKRLAFHEQVKLKPKYTPAAGTRLIRDWNNKRYAVIVREGGFEYEGRVYKSLSSIAGEIVGHKRSGPEFFGLKGECNE